MKILLTHIAVIISGIAVGQAWEIDPLNALNTEQDEMMCGKFDDGMIYCVSDKRQRHTDRKLGEKSFGLRLASRGNTFADLSAIGHLFGSEGEGDEGTAYFNPKDSTLWFSTANPLSDTHRGRVGLYSIRWTGENWDKAIPFRHNSHYHDVMHPWISDKGLLYFSSNMDGTRGKMDIWYSVLLDEQWTMPVNVSHVNSNRNEVFPTTLADTMYFSTSTADQGLELFASWKEGQEGQKRKMNAPFNSEADDFLLVHIDEELAFLTSNRGGKSDDIYLCNRIPHADEIQSLTGLLECLGESIARAVVLVYNSRDELILSDSTSLSGEIALNGLQINRRYKIQVTGVPKNVLEKSVFFFVDDEGNRVRMFRLGKDGFFIFDFLPLDTMESLSHLENVDQSVLTIPIAGKVFENEPGDLDAIQPVYIMDEDENLLALAYTSMAGDFTVPDIRPLSDYMFRIEEGDRELRLVIFEGEEEHVIDVDNDIARFSRISSDEAVRLVDENNEQLFIKDDEVFIIKNIYYQLDSANLNSVAEQQLSQLAAIMKRNPQISLELSSHTDSRGTHDYNINLSERRALSAFVFMKDSGIEPQRIEARGFGEMNLLNHCVDGVECDEKHHALNRRTEIKIRVNEGY